MASNSSSVQELEDVLRRIFPASPMRVHPNSSQDGIRAAQADVEIAIGNVRLLIEFLGNSSRARLLDAVELSRLERADDPEVIPVLASSYLSPSNQELLRERGMAFLDLAGNAWIIAPRLHVDRRGFQNPRPEDRGSRDLFSDKASLVLRVLMRERDPLGIREIAEIVSSGDDPVPLSPGYVSKIVAELERRGYVGSRGQGVVLRRPVELLNEWVVSYRKRRKPSSKSYFLPAADIESLMPRISQVLDAEGVEYVYSGHAGASLVDRHAAFDSIDLYVKDARAAQDPLIGLGARLVDRGGNVNVMLPHYRVSAFYDYQMPRGAMRVASNIQLYLDLYDYPVRGREQAEHLYERYLRPMLERDDQL